MVETETFPVAEVLCTAVKFYSVLSHLYIYVQKNYFYYDFLGRIDTYVVTGKKTN